MNKVYVFYIGGLVREHLSDLPIKIEFAPPLMGPDSDEPSKAQIMIHLEHETVFHEWDYVDKISSEGEVTLWQ